MLNELAKEVHRNAVKHGWWEQDFSDQELTLIWEKLSATPGLRDRVIEKLKLERSFGDIISLCHSELSEALEEHRNGLKPKEIYFNTGTQKGLVWDRNNNKNQKPEGIPTELADCIIRILDYCGKEGIDIDEAIRIKHEYNKSRPYRHGGKVI